MATVATISPSQPQLDIAHFRKLATEKGFANVLDSLPTFFSITITTQTQYPESHPYILLLGTLRHQPCWLGLGSPALKKPNQAPTMVLYVGTTQTSLRNVGCKELETGDVQMVEPFKTLWDDAHDFERQGLGKSYASDQRRGMVKAMAYWYFLGWAEKRREGFAVQACMLGGRGYWVSALKRMAEGRTRNGTDAGNVGPQNEGDGRPGAQRAPRQVDGYHAAAHTIVLDPPDEVQQPEVEIKVEQRRDSVLGDVYADEAQEEEEDLQQNADIRPVPAEQEEEGSSIVYPWTAQSPVERPASPKRKRADNNTVPLARIGAVQQCPLLSISNDLEPGSIVNPIIRSVVTPLPEVAPVPTLAMAPSTSVTPPRPSELNFPLHTNRQTAKINSNDLTGADLIPDTAEDKLFQTAGSWFSVESDLTHRLGNLKRKAGEVEKEARELYGVRQTVRRKIRGVFGGFETGGGGM